MLDSIQIISIVDILGVSLLGLTLLIYFIAGVVKGTIGIGFPTTVISLLAQFVDARTAIGLAIIPMVVTNVWQVYRSRQIIWALSNFWIFWATMLVGIAVFTLLASTIPVMLLTLVLGVVIALYAATSLYKPVVKISPQHDTKAQLIGGVFAGAMGGLAGLWAPPIVIYLTARGVSKEQFVATSGVLLFSGSSILLFGYWQQELVSPSIMILSCVLVIPAMLGMVIGERLRNALSAKGFERVLLWTFLLMGLNLVRRALM